jgi:hypothetical protein
MLPTDTEVAQVSACPETRNAAELFVKDAATFRPLLARRLQTFLVCEQFTGNASSLLLKTNTIIDCCRKVSGDEPVIQIMYFSHILALLGLAWLGFHHPHPLHLHVCVVSIIRF